MHAHTHARAAHTHTHTHTHQHMYSHRSLFTDTRDDLKSHHRMQGYDVRRLLVSRHAFDTPRVLPPFPLLCTATFT